MDLTLLHVMMGVGSPCALHRIWTSDPDSTVISLGALVKTGVTGDVKPYVSDYSTQKHSCIHQCTTWKEHLVMLSWDLVNCQCSVIIMSMKGQKVESERGISESSRPKWIGLFKELYPNILTPNPLRFLKRQFSLLLIYSPLGHPKCRWLEWTIPLSY